MAFAFGGEKMIARQQRYRLGSHVSKNKPAELLCGISRMDDRVFEFAAFWFPRCLPHATVVAVKPTVITASQAVLLDVAKAKIGSAVGAPSADDRRLSGAVTI